MFRRSISAAGQSRSAKTVEVFGWQDFGSFLWTLFGGRAEQPKS
jgi:hypothetical protein